MRVSKEELQTVKIAMDSEKRARVYKRYRALYLYLSGKTCNEVVEMVGLSKPMVCRINKAYATEGLAGIPDKPRTGRPRNLTAEQESHVKEVILTKIPSDVGFPAEFNWTADLARKYISREYNVEYSIRGITGIFDRLGLSYTRPTYVLAKADKQKQEQFVQDFEKVKKSFWTMKSNESSSAMNP